MSEASPARVLIVANRTAATPALIAAVRQRAHQGPCKFTLLVPRLASEEWFADEEARNTIELAVPLLEEAAGGTVEAAVGPSDALLAVERTLVREHYDEVIISTLPSALSQWLRSDLPSRVRRTFEVPVTTVTARVAPRV